MLLIDDIAIFYYRGWIMHPFSGCVLYPCQSGEEDE
jgi:hypothetical protein